MKMQVYHQIGFRHIWNISSLGEDGAGDGIIIAPRHMARTCVENLPKSIREKAIFDPQFFLPNVAKGKLVTYDFFPDVMSEGFQTDVYIDKFSLESARKCVEFQESNFFRYITIPTRYVTGMPTTYMEDQQELFINPFLKAIIDMGIKRKILLQLVLNDDMIKDEEYSSDILNWVTGITEIDGVYLIVERSLTPKQVKDIDYLYSLLRFVDILRLNNLDVVIGYVNIEAILLSLADPSIVTIGSYENTRMFNIRAFEASDDREITGPTPRLYISRLLQCVDYRYIGAIIRATDDKEDFFDKNKYQSIMFEPNYKWHFTKPEIYKHLFLVFGKQLEDLSGLEGRERYIKVAELIKSAMNDYSMLEERGVVFDENSDGSHLPIWLTAANQFAKHKGWR